MGMLSIPVHARIIDSMSSGRLLWYVAYGSNMSSRKFSGDRGIVPLAIARVTIPGWTLTMEVPGLPYKEPAMSSISLISADTTFQSDPSKIIEVHGVAYLVTAEQHKAIIASEGGGIAYDDVTLRAVALDKRDEDVIGKREISVQTLVNVASMSRRNPMPLPSRRYKSLLLAGAAEAGLPPEYQQYLEAWPEYEFPNPPGQRCCRRGRKLAMEDRDLEMNIACTKSADVLTDDGIDVLRTWLGALIFLAVWTPALAGAERLCKSTLRPKDGQCPGWVKQTVRWLVWLIWWGHDAGFVAVFGAGDGRHVVTDGMRLTRDDSYGSRLQVAFRPWWDVAPSRSTLNRPCGIEGQNGG